MEERFATTPIVSSPFFSKPIKQIQPGRGVRGRALCQQDQNVLLDVFPVLFVQHVYRNKEDGQEQQYPPPQTLTLQSNRLAHVNQEVHQVIHQLVVLSGSQLARLSQIQHTILLGGDFLTSQGVETNTHLSSTFYLTALQLTQNMRHTHVFEYFVVDAVW